MNKKILITLVTALVFIAASASGAGVYLWKKSSQDKTAIKQFQKKLKTADNKINSLENKTSDNKPKNNPKTNKGNTKASSLISSKEIGYIKQVYDNDGNTYLVIDYAQMLFGKQAIEAATQDGYIKPGESLDNDYYIRNHNNKLRTFKILKTAPVYVTQNGNNKILISHDKFKKLIIEKPNDSTTIYWINLKGEVVQKIEEQYLP